MQGSYEWPHRRDAAAFGLALLAVTLLSAGGALLPVDSARAQDTPAPPGLVFAFEVRAEVADPLVIGELPEGTRRIVDIEGGSVTGPGIAGRIRPGGADWQLIRSEDGFTVVDARYTIETESGSLIYVQVMFGLRLYGEIVGPSFEVDRFLHLSLVFMLVVAMVALMIFESERPSAMLRTDIRRP